MKDLTKKQLNILNVIKNFIDEFGYSPTIREIGNITGLSSSATIWAYLRILEDKGYITYKKGAYRTIRVIER